MSELPNYRLERVFDAPRELVWSTWAIRPLLPRWYGPNAETMILGRHRVADDGELALTRVPHNARDAEIAGFAAAIDGWARAGTAA